MRLPWNAWRSAALPAHDWKGALRHGWIHWSYLQLITPLRLALCLIALKDSKMQLPILLRSEEREEWESTRKLQQTSGQNRYVFNIFWSINHSFAIGSLTSKQWSCNNDQCWLWRIANHCLWYITHILFHSLPHQKNSREPADPEVTNRERQRDPQGLARTAHLKL